MLTELGHIEAIYRYPVKSMAGEQLETASLGWHGLEGDRRFALQRIDDHGGFPFLTASSLPDLVRFSPLRRDGSLDDLPSHVRTPDGDELPIFSDDLAADATRRHGSPVKMMHIRHGVFDDAPVSVIASETIGEIARLAGRTLDIRRFRPNVVLRLQRPAPWQEDTWLGGMLLFGDAEAGPCVAVTMRDVRCSMVNLDPDSAAPAPEILKAIVKANQNNAGIYATVVRTGRLAVGQTVMLSTSKQ